MTEGIFSNPANWVALAFVLLVALLYPKVARLLANVLDTRSAQIDAELSAARRLREEAEEVLASYKKKQTEYTKEAEAILQKARLDADHLVAHADKSLKLALEARTVSALERIAQEEATAISEVRTQVIDISLAAARSIVLEQIAQTPPQEMITLALADIDRKIRG